MITTPSGLRAALRASVHGIYTSEAGVELLIGHHTFLNRGDFTALFIEHGAHLITGGPFADIDWPAAIAALDTGDLPCSGSEQRILRLAASIADGIPVNLRDALTALDDHNLQLLTTAIRHASGRRPL